MLFLRKVNRARFLYKCRRGFFFFVRWWYLHWWFFDWGKSLFQSDLCGLKLFFVYFFGILFFLSYWTGNITLCEWIPMSFFKHGLAKIPLFLFFNYILLDRLNFLRVFWNIILLRRHWLYLILGRVKGIKVNNFCRFLFFITLLLDICSELLGFLTSLEKSYNGWRLSWHTHKSWSRRDSKSFMFSFVNICDRWGTFSDARHYRLFDLLIFCYVLRR